MLWFRSVLRRPLGFCLLMILLISSLLTIEAIPLPLHFSQDIIPKTPATLISEQLSQIGPPESAGSIQPGRETIIKGYQSVSVAENRLRNKLENFLTRSISAIMLISILAGFVLLTGAQGLIHLTIFLQAGMYHEATQVVETGKFEGLGRWWLFLTYFVWIDGPLLLESSRFVPMVSFGMTALGVLVLVTALNQQHPEDSVTSFKSALSNLSSSNLSAIILIGAASFWIRTLQTYGMGWLFFSAALVVVNDTMAYIFGMLFGKHALLPSISPKKTWEGFIGAFVCTVLLSVPVFRLLVKQNPIATRSRDLLIIAGYVSIVAPFGGFLASVVKRAHGVKDFGQLIPGHGGLVDRLDCQVMTAPFVYLYLRTFCGEEVTILSP